jgi:Fic family protein
MQHLLLLKEGQDIARFVPSETAIMRQRNSYYAVLRESRELKSLHPVLEFLTQCFAISAEEVVAEGKALFKASAARRPEIRHRKILNFAKGKVPFSMQEIVSLMPDIPRCTLERDLAILTKKKILKRMAKRKREPIKASTRFFNGDGGRRRHGRDRVRVLQQWLRELREAQYQTLDLCQLMGDCHQALLLFRLQR